MHFFQQHISIVCFFLFFFRVSFLHSCIHCIFPRCWISWEEQDHRLRPLHWLFLPWMVSCKFLFLLKCLQFYILKKTTTKQQIFCNSSSNYFYHKQFYFLHLCTGICALVSLLYYDKVLFSFLLFTFCLYNVGIMSNYIVSVRSPIACTKIWKQ